MAESPARWRSSLWPAYLLFAGAPGIYAAVRFRSLGVVLLFVAFFWLVFTLGFAISIDAPKAQWRLGGPAKWSYDRPLLTALISAVIVICVALGSGGALWRSALTGTGYGSILGLVGLLLRRRRRARG